MYFPYLRCKQFELLALRELISPLSESGKIKPVLEPVKSSTSPLEKALDSLIAGNVNFTIIVNPLFGDFARSPQDLYDFINRKLSAYDNFQFGLIIEGSADFQYLDNILGNITFSRPLSLIHRQRVGDLQGLIDWAANYQIKYNLYNDHVPIRRYRELISDESKVLLEDKFLIQEKNADYTSDPEPFSDEHLYYSEDGLIGFGDYLTIGNEYAETGFLPFAVAIHLTYIRTDKNNEIWIRHFVSDSNSDNTDVAGKFGEALVKLIAFIDDQQIRTNAADEFRELARTGHYPGLGSLKKLSIRNHLELLLSLL